MKNAARLRSFFESVQTRKDFCVIAQEHWKKKVPGMVPPLIDRMMDHLNVEEFDLCLQFGLHRPFLQLLDAVEMSDGEHAAKGRVWKIMHSVRVGLDLNLVCSRFMIRYCTKFAFGLTQTLGLHPLEYSSHINFIYLVREWYMMKLEEDEWDWSGFSDELSLNFHDIVEEKQKDRMREMTMETWSVMRRWRDLGSNNHLLGRDLQWLTEAVMTEDVRPAIEGAARWLPKYFHWWKSDADMLIEILKQVEKEQADEVGG